MISILNKICRQEYSSPYVQGSYWARKLLTTHVHKQTYAAPQQTPFTEDGSPETYAISKLYHNQVTASEITKPGKRKHGLHKME